MPSTPDELRASAEHLLRKAELLESFGTDDFPSGSVITFTKRFRGKPRVSYTYAAVKIAGFGTQEGTWYLTASTHSLSRSFTWTNLIAWLLDDIPTTEIWWATDFELVHRTGNT